MEQFTEKQISTFQAFYQQCQSKGINPLENEAGRQRALIIARENKDLVTMLDTELDGRVAEAYRVGMESIEAQAAARDAAQRRANDEAAAAQQRSIDQETAARDRELAQKRGRDKRQWFYARAAKGIEARINTAQGSAVDAAKLWAGLNALEVKQESSWGTLGGIAAGITGSTAVGAAVAADTMRKNEGVRAHNKAVVKRNMELTQPLVDEAWKREERARKELRKLQDQMEKEKLTLVEERPMEELMKGLSLSEPQVAYTKGGTMVVKVELKAAESYQIAGDVPAVIDGNFAAEVYEGDTLVGRAYLNLPLWGAEKPCVLEGLCPEARRDVQYTVVLVPMLWLIERYQAGKVEIAGELRRNGEVTDWEPFALHKSITWQQRVKEEQEKAEVERAAEERRAKAKKLAKVIGIPAVIAIILTAVLIFSFQKAQREEAVRQEAYQAAAALANRGDFDDAIAAFAELGTYQDSAEQITNTTYRKAMAFMNSGKYDDAIAIFTELGDYRDSAEQILETNYKKALSLLLSSHYDQAVELFEELGDYKDSAEQIAALKNSYAQAVSLLENGDYQAARDAFSKLKNYMDSDKLAKKAELRLYMEDFKETGSTESVNNLKKFSGSRLSTNKIKSVVPGTWLLTEAGQEPVIFLFNADGTTGDGGIKWGVSFDDLWINGRKGYGTYTMYKLDEDEGVYILITPPGYAKDLPTILMEKQ